MIPLSSCLNTYLLLKKLVKFPLHFMSNSKPILTQWSHFWEYILRNLNTNSKVHKHPYVHCSIIYNHQDMEGAQVSISRWVDETTMAHLYNGILLDYKNEESFLLCNSMDRPGEHYAKWNKPVGERQIPYDFTHMWNLINKLNRKMEIDS